MLLFISPGLQAIIIIAIILLIIIIKSIRIVPQAQEHVVERLGVYQETWGAGLHVKIPFIDSIVNKVSLKEKVADFEPQAVITKDNVTMQIDTVVFYQVLDSKLFTYGIHDPISAIENLTATTLRNVVGDLELDETLTSRDRINAEMREILDMATDPWGIKINRVELKSITPPAEIQDAMERQMKAERTKREQILLAEGEKESRRLVAEGYKDAAILDAEAEKQSEILKAEGEALAIRIVQQARADGLNAIKEVKPDQGLISLKALETMEHVADGKATKIIIPSEIQGLAGLAVSASELIRETDNTNS